MVNVNGVVKEMCSLTGSATAFAMCYANVGLALHRPHIGLNGPSGQPLLHAHHHADYTCS
jgi:hypothetical protein